MIRSIDLGYGSVKAISPARQIEFPSAIGTFRPVRFTSGMENAELQDRLCVEFESKRYFVGSIAFLQGNPRATLNKERFTSSEGLALLMAALALLSINQVEEVKLIAGLPVNEFAGLKTKYREALLGQHYIQLIDPEGKEGDFYRFDIDDVKILPQPMGSLFDAVLDDAGGLADKGLAGGRLACLDIGKHTTDLALVDALNFVDKSSTSYNDLGLFESFKEISLALKGVGYDIPPDNLEPYIRGNRTLPGLPQIKEQAFASLAERIVSRVVNTWPDLWSFDRVYISGGGAEVVGSYITEALETDKAIINTNATMTNCRGFYKYGQRVFK